MSKKNLSTISHAADLKNGRAALAVVGLGYVGLPLAVEFGKIVRTVGYDVSQKRAAELKRGHDANKDLTREEIRAAKRLEFTASAKNLKHARFIIVAVPTPVTKAKQPDLSFVEAASIAVGKNLSRGSIVVFEPTVYPGVTEEICVPLLEKHSGLRYKKDFKVGYSPERINPGDKAHGVTNILKVVSGCDEESLEEIAAVYRLIVKAGVYKADSIKTAEAAKVIENTQRDLNIALMNELALIFHRLGLDTRAVIEAAGTKWNFIKLYPGLVGGHCIGVDPYYLTFKAEQAGYHPQVILSGRKVNDYMGKYVAEQTVKHLIEGKKKVKGARVMVMGITFKENVSDIRNSRVIDLIHELKEYGTQVLVFDPLADKKEVRREHGIDLKSYDPKIKADAVVVVVNHDAYKKTLTLSALRAHLAGANGRGVVIDVKGMFRPQEFKDSGLLYWRL